MSRCLWCKEEVLTRKVCPATKIWEFDNARKTVTVYHEGIHTCTFVSKDPKVDDSVCKSFAETTEPLHRKLLLMFWLIVWRKMLSSGRKCTT